MENRATSGQVPAVKLDIPLHVAGMVGGECGRHLHNDLATCGSGRPPGGKRQLIREGGSAARISNELGPPDCSGGVRLTTARTKT